MDVTNVLLNHYGHAQDHLQSAHSNVEMDYFKKIQENNVMMVTEEMGMAALRIAK
jgi:hypothetical protein